MRLATPLHPILDNLYAESFYFFVPYRTIWDSFEKFHGAQDDPGDSIDFTIPSMTDTTLNVTTANAIYDYFGWPWVVSFDSTVASALPLRAYRKIFNDWFRDENLQVSGTERRGNGPDLTADYTLRKRGKRFDYFTSCLTSPQKGTAVSLPLGTTADIKTAASAGQIIGVWSDNTSDWHQQDSDGPFVDLSATVGSVAETNKLYADLTGATASTINDIRLAFQTQRLLERDARSGTRYIEALKAHWGISNIQDYRLQRAEFLGGGSSSVNVTPVAQTSGQPVPLDDDALGNLAGFGTASGTHSFSKSFVEHGVLIGLMNVRGDVTYSQGLDRFWNKKTRYDFFYPVLSQIGEQSVLNREIWYTSAGEATNILVFGYQERYAEYRHANSRLTGLFRPDHATTLAAWHLSEDFATLPTLGNAFIEANTGVPLDRAIAVSTEPHFIADIFFNIKAARPMPTYGVPGNIDRL